MKKLLLVAGTALLASLAACSDSTTGPQAPRSVAPKDKASSDLVCRSGYIIAYDENGNPYCAPDPNSGAATMRPRP